MTAHSLILTPHEVLAALRGELGLVVRPVKGLGDIDFTSVRLSSFHSLWGPDAWVFETPMDKEETGFEAISQGIRCPLGTPGDRLVGKESWAHDAPSLTECRRYPRSFGPYYRASLEADGFGEDGKWLGYLSWRSPATLPARAKERAMGFIEYAWERVDRGYGWVEG